MSEDFRPASPVEVFVGTFLTFMFTVLCAFSAYAGGYTRGFWGIFFIILSIIIFGIIVISLFNRYIERAKEHPKKVPRTDISSQIQVTQMTSFESHFNHSAPLQLKAQYKEAELRENKASSLLNSQENPPRDIEQAIKLWKENLRFFERVDDQVNWATTHHNLASAYRHRIEGDPAQNIELAIEHCLLALDVREKDPELRYFCAGTWNILANCFENRIEGVLTDNIEEAIKYHHKALEVRTRSEYPLEWARTQNNLGNAYLKRSSENPEEDIMKAIECYEKALEIRTEESYPDEWATTKNNLASAFVKLSEISKNEKRIS